MTLPNDIARCSGVGSDEDGWREGCEDCLRLTAPGNPAGQWYMTAPVLVVFFCESYIPPEKSHD